MTAPTTSAPNATLGDAPSASGGLPVLLVPSLGGSARLYGGQVAALHRHGPVIVERPVDDDSIAAMAERILANAPPRFALAGLSMGGYIALEIVSRAPARVARLALLDTSARVDTADERAGRLRQIGVAKSGRYASLADDEFAATVDPAHAGDAGKRETFRLMLEDTGAAAFVRQQRAALGRRDARPGLAAVRCPTLVLVGDHDAITPLPHARELADGVAGARLVVVADCGHLSAIDQPAAVTRALVAWLDG